MSAYHRLSNLFNLPIPPLNGAHKKYYNDGTLRIESIYLNGELNGAYKEYNEDGTLMLKENYKQGRQHGLSSYYSSNGTLMQEALFYNDKLKTILLGYNSENGLHIIADHEEGIRNGSYKAYYHDRRDRSKKTLIIEANYKNDLIDGIYKEYHYDGSLSIQAEYKEGYCNGSFKKYYDDDAISMETTCIGLTRSYGNRDLNKNIKIKGSIDGTYTEYYGDGSLKLQGTYRDNLKHGCFISYANRANASNVNTQKPIVNSIKYYMSDEVVPESVFNRAQRIERGEELPPTFAP